MQEWSRGARGAASEGGWGVEKGQPIGVLLFAQPGEGLGVGNNPGTPGTGMLIISPWTDTRKLLTRSCSPRVGGSDNWKWQLPGCTGGPGTICTFLGRKRAVGPGTLETGQGPGSLQMVQSRVDTQHWSSSEPSDQGDQLCAPAQIPWRSSPKQFLLCGFHYFSPKS